MVETRRFFSRLVNGSAAYIDGKSAFMGRLIDGGNMMLFLGMIDGGNTALLLAGADGLIDGRDTALLLLAGQRFS
jgi:hypothetical protein